MKLTTIIKIAALTTGLLSLAACSTTGTMSRDSVPASAMQDAQTLGLGQSTRIAGTNFDLANRLKAPYDQIYFFDFNKSVVHPRYNRSIDIQADYLLTHPSAHVLLIGNTDIRGSREYNIALGERRALAVVNRLKMDGVSSKQIRTLSYGPEMPIAKGNTLHDYALNRNVQLIYKGK